MRAVPQLTPSVERVHACVSVRVEATHWLSWQAYDVTVTSSVPLVAHTSAALHVPEGTRISAGQSLWVSQPSHVFVVGLHADAPGQGSTMSCTHSPSEQVSAPLQSIPSSQLAVFGVKTQPVPAMHASSVQRLPSSHPASGHSAPPSSCEPPSGRIGARSSVHPARSNVVHSTYREAKGDIAPRIDDTPPGDSTHAQSERTALSAAGYSGRGPREREGGLTSIASRARPIHIARPNVQARLDASRDSRSSSRVSWSAMAI